MRTFIKTLLWILGILIILYLGASFFLMRLISPTIISKLEDTLTKQLHAPAKIEAKFSVKFFPQPAVTLSNATVELGTNKVRSTIQRAHIALKFKPLLSRQIVPTVLELKNANIDLTNIKGIVAPTKRPIKIIQTNRSKSLPAKPQQSSVSFHLPRVVISNSQFKWQNPRTKRIMSLTDVNLSIDPKTNLTTLNGGFKLSYDKQIHQLKLNANVSRPNTKQIDIKPLHFDVTSQSGNQKSTLNVSTLVDMNLATNQVKLTALKGRLNGTPFSGIAQAKWQTQGTQLTNTSNLALKMAGGQVLIGFNYQSPIQKMKLAVNTKSVDLNTMSHALQLDNPMKGTAAFQASLSAQKQNHQWIPHLNGSGRFQLNNVQFGKTDFGSVIDEGAKRFNKKSGNTSHGVTTFSTISGTFNIHDGVFYNSDLALQTKNNELSGKGNGHINLVHKQINYRLTLELNKMKNFVLPLKIKGSINHPKVKPDFGALGENLLKQAIKKHSFKSLFHDKKFNLKSLF